MVPDIALVTEDQVIWPWLIFFYVDVTRTGSMDSPCLSHQTHTHIIYMYIFHGASGELHHYFLLFYMILETSQLFLKDPFYCCYFIKLPLCWPSYELLMLYSLRKGGKLSSRSSHCCNSFLHLVWWQYDGQV